MIVIIFGDNGRFADILYQNRKPVGKMGIHRKILVTVVLFMAVVLSKGQTFEDLTCNYICPDNAEPVCGFNGEEYEEFATECELKNANCLLGRIQTKGKY